MKLTPLILPASGFLCGVALTVATSHLWSGPPDPSSMVDSITVAPRKAQPQPKNFSNPSPPSSNPCLATHLQTIQEDYLKKVRESGGAAAVTSAAMDLTPGELDMVLPDILKEWGALAPKEAIAWYVEGAARDAIPGGADYNARSALLESAFKTLAATDPVTAAALANSLETEAEWQTALIEVGRAAVLHDKTDGLLGTTPELTDDQRFWLKSSIFSQWAMLRPAEALTAFGALPVEEQPVLLPSVGRAWLRAEPSKAAEWWIDHAGVENRAATMSEIMNSWASLSPNQAAQWLETRPEDAAKDSGRSALAQNAFERDPESALAWAASIQNPDERHTVWLDLLRTLSLKNHHLASEIAKRPEIPEAWKTASASFLSPNP